MTTHILVGTGAGVDIPQSVINESLRDILKEGDAIVLPWYGKPEPAMEQVYDYVLDQGIEFEMLYTEEATPPAKALREAENGVAVGGRRWGTEDMSLAYASSFDGGMFLVLGEDDATNDMILAVHPLIDRLTPVDLGDGLTAINVNVDDDVDGPEEAAPAEDPENAPVQDAPDPLGFSRHEMMSMPVRTLKELCRDADVPEMPTGNERAPYIQALEAMKSDGPTQRSETIGEALEFIQKDIMKMQEDAPSRRLALILTHIEEASLWYYYGADIHK